MADVELWNRLTYDYIKESNILNVSDTYQIIATLVTPDRLAGVYEFAFSLSCLYTATNTNVFLRWRLDGGTWTEHQLSTNDIDAAITQYYSYPDVYVEGIHTFELEMKKEVVGNTLNINYLDLMFKRVGVST